MISGQGFLVKYTSEVRNFVLNFRMCITGCLDTDLVDGKIVLCDSAGGAPVVHWAGGVGSVHQTEMTENVTSVSPIPALALLSHDFGTIKAYFKSAK